MKKVLRIVVIALMIAILVPVCIIGYEKKQEKKAFDAKMQLLIDAKAATIEKSLDQTNFKVTVYRSDDGGETFYLSFVSYRDGSLSDAKLKYWSCRDFGWLMSSGSDPKVYIYSEDEIQLNDWIFSNPKAFNGFPTYARGFLMESFWVPLTVDNIKKFEESAKDISIADNIYKKSHYKKCFGDGSYGNKEFEEIINDEGLLLEYFTSINDGWIEHVIISELGEVSISDELPTYGTILTDKWRGKYVWDSTPSSK